MKIRISVNIKYYIFLSILIILAKNGFYLWEDNQYLIFGYIKYADLGLVFATCFVVYVGINCGLKMGSGRYDYYIFFYIILTIIASFTATIIYGQSLARGFFAQRVQIFWFLTYFPIRRLLQLKKIESKSVINLLYFFALYELFICTLQYFLGDKVIFLSVLTGSRNYSARYYFNVSLLVPISFISLYGALNCKANRVRNVAIVIWTAVLIMLFSQYRSIAVYFGIGCLIVIALWNKNVFKKLVIIFAIIVGAYFVIRNTSFFKSLITTITSGVFNDANMIVRNNAREHYLSEVGKSIGSILLGRGYPSVSSYEAFSAAGYYNYMYFNDNGIFGMIYCYGAIGVLWYVLFWLKLMRDSWKMRIRISAFVAYISYYIIGLINDFSWFWSANFMFVIIVCLLEVVYKDSKYNLKEG